MLLCADADGVAARCGLPALTIDQPVADVLVRLHPIMLWACSLVQPGRERVDSPFRRKLGRPLTGRRLPGIIGRLGQNRMSLVSFFRSLFARPVCADESASGPPQSDAATAVLEVQSHANEAQVADANAWWVPRGEPTIVRQKPRADAYVRERRLYDQCVRALDNANVELPQLPQVSQQLLMMLAGEGPDLRRAAEVAERDPALTAGVLRLVNSAAYRRVVEVRQLDQAFARLGQRALRSFLLASTVKQVAIRIGGPQRTLGEELWRRSLASGAILADLADRHGLPEDDAFLAGLLHDIGMLAVLKVVHDFERSAGQKVSRELFDALSHEWHEHMGLRLADAWGLPDPLPAICGNHHRDPAEDDPLATCRDLIALADAICALLEFAPYVPYGLFNLPCARRLGLADDGETRAWLADLPDVLTERVQLI